MGKEPATLDTISIHRHYRFGELLLYLERFISILLGGAGGDHLLETFGFPFVTAAEDSDVRLFRKKKTPGVETEIFGIGGGDFIIPQGAYQKLCHRSFACTSN